MATQKVPAHPTTYGLDWNTPTLEMDIPFTGVRDFIDDLADWALGQVDGAVNATRDAVLAYLPDPYVIDPPGLDPIDVRAATRASAEAARQLASGLLTSLKNALSNLEAELDVLYIAKDGCPVGANDRVNAEAKVFNAPKLPDFDQEIEVGLSAPVVASGRFTFRFKHQWSLTWPPVEVSNIVHEEWFDDSTEPPTPLGEETVGAEKLVLRRSVCTTYAYQLTYRADIKIGPASLPLDATTYSWFIGHTACSDYCPPLIGP